MQMRLEKSRSMESISSLSEEFSTEKWSVPNKHDSKNDETISENNILMHSAIVEDVNNQDAVEEYVESILFETEINEHDQEDDDVFIEHGTSLEDIYETSTNQTIKYHEEEIRTSPSKRVTVGERIKAAIERRRESRKLEKRRKLERADIDNPEQIFLSNKPSDVSKRKNKVASVAVALVEAKGIENQAADDETVRQLYCRIRLGQEKQKSKPAKINENVVSWQELFNFNLYDDQYLEITLVEREKDVIVGKVIVDLSELKFDKTHKMMLHLEEVESVELFILVTMSAALRENNETGLSDDETKSLVKPNEILEMRHQVLEFDTSPEHRFGQIHFFDEEDQTYLCEIFKLILSRLLLNDDFDYVGLLHVSVYKAMGLVSSDCFAVLIIDNDRCQTHADHKTHDPAWFKTFTFEIKDATSILYVIIYDEKKTDIVGKLAIPLMKIYNGEQKWYSLKDESLTRRAKGHNPRILLEINFYFNVVRQSVRLINPKERIYLRTEPEFKPRLLASNIKRLKVIINWITEALRVVKTLFEWENKILLNEIALLAWLVFWYFFQAWMVPLLLLIPFHWYKPAEYNFSRFDPSIFRKNESEDQSDRKSLDSIDGSQDTSSLRRQSSTSLRKSGSKDRQSTSSLRKSSSTTLINESQAKGTSIVEKLTSFGEVIRTAQNGIGFAASLGESIKNLFNFTVPFISFFSIVSLINISVILFYLEFRYILMFWAVHKYLRKILRPNKVPNNEILDLLSRVPDDETLLQCEEIPLEEEPQRHHHHHHHHHQRRSLSIYPMGL
ncbi:c2 domain-containing protein [Phthorimaea operculella]|nr:c2 domain-containing protein [Phthorimaea operculella]